LFESAGLPLHDHRPGGETDSERLFLYLLEQMTEDIAHGVRRVADTVRSHPYTSMTFLLTDGHKLIAYRDVGHPEPGATPKESRRYYTLYALFRRDMYIVCSEPLPFFGQPWRQLEDGDLLIISTDAGIRRRVNLKESLQVATRT